MNLSRLHLPAALVAFTLTLSTSQAALVNRWSFNATAGNAPAGTTVADSVGTATATVVGNDATFSGAALTLPGTSIGNFAPANISAYVDLPNGLISSKTNLSVEIWATPASIKNWQRLFDFGRMGTLTTSVRGSGLSGEIAPDATQAPNNAASSDDLALAIHRDSTANTQRLMARLDAAAELASNTGAILAAGTQYHFVCTFTDGAGTSGSAGGQVAWYLNGTLVTTLDVNFHLSAIQDRNNWLGRSMYTADSNANIAYDEVRLYDHVLSMAEITANLGAGPDSIVAPPDPDPEPAPTPDHLWVFNNQADSSVDSGLTFTDSVGGMVATLRGNGAALTGTSVRLPGSTTGNQTAAAISAYLDLPNGILSAKQSITFEAWATPLSSKNWQRLFDFGRCVTTHGTGAAPGETLDGTTAPGATVGYDNISLTFNSGTNLNSQQLEGQYDGNAAVYSLTTAATTAGTEYHYVLIIENGVGIYGAAGCQVRWYRNGALQNSMDFAFLSSAMENVNNWIGRSMYSGDSNSNLALNELRIYNRAITPGEVLASYEEGADPNSGPAEPLPPAPLPENRWSFNNPAGTSATSGTTFTDTSTLEIATVRGTGASLDGTALVLPGTTNGNQTAAAISAYLDLRNGIVSEHPSLTFEAWARPLSSKNWQRLFDFGNSSITSGAGAAPGEIIDGGTAPGNFVANDSLFLSLNVAGTLGSHRLAAKINGGAETGLNTDLSSITTPGTEYHYVLTVEDGAGAYGSSGCQVRWFRNGELQGSADLAYRLTDLTDVNNWIGRSMWAADTNSNLALNELRFYPRAISSTEVISSYQAGSGATFPAPTAVADSATIHPNQKVLVDVLANDTGSPIAASLQIITPPATGTATVKDGQILYTHSGGSSSPVTFTYRVGNVSGTTVDALVTINFAASLRINNPALGMPSTPPSTFYQVVDALPGVTFAEPICISTVPGDTQRLFVCERMAKIQLVPDVTAASPTKQLFLNLQTAIAGRTPTETIANWSLGENGLLGLAFHPQYASNGYFYIAYTVLINGSYYERVSRFSVSAGDPNVANPASELILLEQLDQDFNHNGGDLHFGPDGYLYYTAGDEANGYDYRLNSQRINKDFFAGIFRLDVDKKPGNREPNAHAAIPTDGGIARFSVPVDNPYVHTSLGGTWDGTYNGVAIADLSTVRMEFWATGLRHVWRFSIDPLNGDIWAGDVGQDKYEEIDFIVKGGNYGWVYREGAHDTNFTNPVPPAKPAGFTSTDPAYEYPHSSIAPDPQFGGNSVVGGHVYRGTRFPALYGHYIFCDSVSGHIWKRDPSDGSVTRITGVPGVYGGLVSMGVDPATQDLLFAHYINGQILRLSTGSVTTTFPATLSETGLFADISDLSPSPGLLPYLPNLRFWSDYADKTRWFYVPGAGTMTWQRDANWTYPAGMIFVKHFDLELTRGNPATKRRIETRVLVEGTDGLYGVSYRWNDAQTEATLVPDEGVEFDLDIDVGGVNHVQRWAIPSRSSCITCHTPQSGGPLSFNTRQLNRDFTINGYSGNQLSLLHTAGFFNNTPESPNVLPRHVRPDETAFSVEARVRSYLAVNCSYCHRADGTVAGANWDGRPQLALAQTGLINGIAENDGGNPANRYVVPGDIPHSIVYNRIAAANGFTRMPPLATSELDTEAIALVQQWIGTALPARQTYDQWRLAQFTTLGSPEGAADADPDGDSMTNEAEFIAGTDPLDPGSYLTTEISSSGATITLTFNVPADRSAYVETSEDLTTWTLWNVPGNNGMPLPAGTVVLTGPFNGTKQFFRLKLQEN